MAAPARMSVDWFLVDGRGHSLVSGRVEFETPTTHGAAYDATLRVGDAVERAMLQAAGLPIALDAGRDKLDPPPSPPREFRSVAHTFPGGRA